MLKLSLSVLGLFMLVQNIYSDCLTADQYLSLGIENAGTSVENTLKDKVCKNVDNLCVDPEKALELIVAKLEAFNEQLKGQCKGLHGILNNLCGKLLKFANTALELNSKTSKRKPKYELSEEDKATLQDFIDNNEADSCKKLKDSVSAMDTLNDCKQKLIEMIVGAYCFLLSDKASEHFTFDGSGNLTGLQVAVEDGETGFDSCFAFFKQQCYMVNLLGIKVKAGKGKKPQKNGKAKKVQEACSFIKETFDCDDDPSKCSADIKKKFFESFVSIGSDPGMGESENEMDKDDKEVGDEQDDIADQNSRRRVLVTAEADVGLTPVEGGIKISEYGQQSGVEYDQWKHVSAIFIGSIYFVMKLFIK